MPKRHDIATVRWSQARPNNRLQRTAFDVIASGGGRPLNRALGAMDNPHQLAPSEALRRAFWTVKFPSLATFCLPLGTYVAAAEWGYVPSMGYAGMKWAVPAFALSFVGSWLVWSVQVPRWRLWAYQRVDNIELLKELAVERQYLWPEGSFFQKTELMSRSVRDQLRALEARAQHGA